MEILLRKAKNNLEVAELAVKYQYYDEAVSRYYYYLYLNIVYLLNKRRLSHIPNRLGHSVSISNFIQICKEEGSYQQYSRSIQKLWKLKTSRIKSEYNPDHLISTEDNFRLIFQNDYNDVVNTLKKLNFIGVSDG